MLRCSIAVFSTIFCYVQLLCSVLCAFACLAAMLTALRTALLTSIRTTDLRSALAYSPLRALFYMLWLAPCFYNPPQNRPGHLSLCYPARNYDFRPIYLIRRSSCRIQATRDRFKLGSAHERCDDTSVRQQALNDK